VATTVIGGIGATYLLRRLSVLGVGPDIGGALPLQRLADSDAQPLLRIAAAWIPTGLLAGWALRSRPGSPLARILTLAVVSVAELMAIGAVSDATTSSTPVADHIAAQPTRAGTWVAAAFTTAAAAWALARRRAAPRAPSGR
jgi:hypothetical protein